MAPRREFAPPHEYTYDRAGAVRWIVSHALRYPVFPVAMVLAAILNNTFYSAIQVQIGVAFDLITVPGWTAAQLGAIALAVLAMGLGQGLFGLARNYSAEFIAQGVERDARDELYVALLGKSQTFHGRQRIGDIMARATNDVHMLNLMFSPGLMLITDSLMGIAVPIVMIAGIRGDLLLVPACFLVLLAWTLIDYNRQLNPVSQAMRERFGEMNAGLAEAVSGIQVVKSSVQERYEWHKFVRDASRYRDEYVRQGAIQARYLPALAYAICWAGALLHSLLIWQVGGLTLGQVVSYMGLMGALRFPTYISLFTFNLVQLGIAGADRILELIRTETELDENLAGHAAAIVGSVTFDHVSFAYGSAPVLSDVTFSVNPGETVAIVGQTGSGKTALTRLVNRIFDAGRGRILVDGVDVRDWNLAALRSQISTIEQDVFLFSRSIADNIAFGRAGASREEVEAAARDAQAHEFISGLGYDTVIGERGVTLSGGERQRLAIARAFLTNPRILILDDSTSAIDSATEDQIQRAMRRISRQRTTFLITHRLSQIRWADRILLLKHGELADQGTHQELMERNPDYRRIFGRADPPLTGADSSRCAPAGAGA